MPARPPYRDSKLTMLLADSLGGDTPALMIACCSSARSATMESIRTMQVCVASCVCISCPVPVCMCYQRGGGAAGGGMLRRVQFAMGVKRVKNRLVMVLDPQVPSASRSLSISSQSCVVCDVLSSV